MPLPYIPAFPSTAARAAAIFLSAVCCLVSPAFAAGGTYSVTADPTTLDGWIHPGTLGVFATPTDRVMTTTGTFSIGNNRFWRLNVPHDSVRIDTGTLTGRASTPNAAFEIRVREGNFGGAYHTLLASQSATSFSRTLWGDSGWVEFGLVTKTATTTSAYGSNWVALDSLKLRLIDIVAPVTGVLTGTLAESWYGTGCIEALLTGNDAGSGINTSTITNSTAGRTLHTWTEVRQAGLRPGIRSTRHTGCIQGSDQVHGINIIKFTTRDTGGLSTVVERRIRFDLQPPRVHGLATADETLYTSSPSWNIEVTDSDSGLQSLSARIDDTNAVVASTGDVVTVTASAPLAMGAHTLTVTATDNVGNVQTSTHSFQAVDNAPPAITVVSPLEHGIDTPWLTASATDSFSAVDSTTWQTTVDGIPIEVASASATLAASLGRLVPGYHDIVISVADIHGNIGTVRHRYLVDSDSTATASIGGSSGVFVVSQPQLPVAYGTQFSVVVLVAESGRPAVNTQVAALRNGTLKGVATTDDRGIAILRMTAGRPGSIALTPILSSIPTALLTVKVKPRVSLRVSDSTPLRGQRVYLSGRVTPYITGRLVIEAKYGGVWYPLPRTLYSSTTGYYRTSVTVSARGYIPVRVRRPAIYGWSMARSAAQVLHVS